jgi:hypothetical protein
VHVSVGVHPAGDTACLYDGQCHLFSLVEGMARTRWPPDLRTPASSQARQIRTAAPVGATKNLGPADRSIPKTDPDGVSRLRGQAATQAPDPTPPPSQSQGSRAGALPTLSLPTRRGTRRCRRRWRIHTDHSYCASSPASPRIVPGSWIGCRDHPVVRDVVVGWWGGVMARRGDGGRRGSDHPAWMGED